MKKIYSVFVWVIGVLTLYTLPTAYAQCPQDKFVFAESPEGQAPHSTNIIVNQYEEGIMYTLRKDADNSIVAGPQSGSIGLYVQGITETTVYNVLARNPQTGCEIQLSTKPVITITTTECVPPADKQLIVEDDTGMAPHSTNIIVQNPQPGILYSLRLNANNTVIDGPQPGTEPLFTGEVNQTTQYNVLAHDPETQCETVLSTRPVVTITSGEPQPVLLQPDLFSWARPGNYMYDVLIDKQAGVRLLRFSTATTNKGAGPLELHATVESDGTTTATQWIYDDQGGHIERHAGTFVFSGHEGHNHFHFADFANYRLLKVLANNGIGPIVSASDKVTFAMFDVSAYNLTLPGAPATPTYQRPVSQLDRQGISVGWADVYGRSLGDQWVDIAGVPDGEYWLEVTIDPNGLIAESDETNNTTYVKVILKGGRAKTTSEQPSSLSSMVARTSLQLQAAETDVICGGDITLSTQAQVNSFPVTHGCTEITGRLTISGNDITNLDSLSALKTIGNLSILSNSSLTNINGLSNLVESTSGVTAGFPPPGILISNNAVLSDMSGLSSLKKVNQNLIISNNPGLTNLNGLENLTSLGGMLQVSSNARLENIDALSSLTSVGVFSVSLQSVLIIQNTALTSIRGLRSLKSLPGMLVVQGTGLQNLEGLDSLTKISGSRGSLVISSNPFLTNIDALSALTEISGPPTSEGIVQINDNPILTNLNGFSSLRTISGNPVTGLSISRNASLTNVDGFSSLENISSGIRINSNPSLNNLDGFHNLTSIGSIVEIIDNISLRNIDGLSSVQSIGVVGGESLVIKGNRSLENLKGLQLIATIPGGVEISSNPSLHTLEGLESVTHIGGAPFQCCGTIQATFRITANDSLKNVDGLASLISVHRGIIIKDNPLLKNLDGLSSLTTISEQPGSNPSARLEIINNASLKNVDSLSSLTVIGGSSAQLTVTNNIKLKACCGLYPLVQNRLGCSPQPACATITISGNESGCTKEDILANGACSPGDEQAAAIVASQLLVTEVENSSETESNFALYPNPSKGEFDVVIEDDNNGSYNLLVRDFYGKILEKQTITKDGKMVKAHVDMKQARRGIYVLSLYGNGKTKNMQLVITD